jgi:hypothetical protein
MPLFGLLKPAICSSSKSTFKLLLAQRGTSETKTKVAMFCNIESKDRNELQC